MGRERQSRNHNNSHPARDAAGSLREHAQELRDVLDWRAWTDDEALRVLQWIVEDGLPATAEAVLLEHARLEREVNALRDSLDEQRSSEESLEEASDTRALLEDAEQRLEQHEAIYYEYEPLFRYVRTDDKR